jgi:hypothetical protein
MELSACSLPSSTSRPPPHVKEIMCYKLKESSVGRVFVEQDEENPDLIVD